MSYKNNTIHAPYWQMQLDENVIHINKYRFPDFYYEELDKLNMKYYQRTSTDDTVSTGLLLVAQSGTTAFSLNSRPPGVGLEFNVNGSRIF